MVLSAGRRGIASMSTDDDSIEFVRKVMTDQIPFNTALGLRVDVLERGHAQFVIPFRPELVGDPARPALHGGVISALLDTVGGAAVWTTVGMSGRVSTIDLRVDYLLPGRLVDLHADARVIRVGNRVGVVSMRAYHADEPDASVAEGKGVYNIKRIAASSATR
jgi:uncharacterized protein (TIGR00369 family)